MTWPQSDWAKIALTHTTLYHTRLMLMLRFSWRSATPHHTSHHTDADLTICSMLVPPTRPHQAEAGFTILFPVGHSHHIHQAEAGFTILFPVFPIPTPHHTTPQQVDWCWLLPVPCRPTAPHYWPLPVPCRPLAPHYITAGWLMLAVCCLFHVGPLH